MNTLLIVQSKIQNVDQFCHFMNNCVPNSEFSFLHNQFMNPHFRFYYTKLQIRKVSYFYKSQNMSSDSSSNNSDSIEEEY